MQDAILISGSPIARNREAKLRVGKYSPAVRIRQSRGVEPSSCGAAFFSGWRGKLSLRRAIAHQAAAPAFSPVIAGPASVAFALANQTIKRRAMEGAGTGGIYKLRAKSSLKPAASLFACVQPVSEKTTGMTPSPLPKI